MDTVKITLIGGPTALLEVGGLRVLTDPTFDPPGSYAGAATLTKLTGPALKIDCTPLSRYPTVAGDLIDSPDFGYPLSPRFYGDLAAQPFGTAPFFR